MAFELIKDALKQSATDPLTGMIDMDVIVTGHTSSSRKRVELLVNLLKDMFQANPSEYVGKSISFDKLEPQILSNWKLDDFSNKPKEEEIREALQKLVNEGIINTFGVNKNRPMIKYLQQEGMAWWHMVQFWYLVSDSLSFRYKHIYITKSEDFSFIKHIYLQYNTTI